MTDDERKKEQELQDERMKSNLSRIKKSILVMSGKGGVGKTTVAVNIACGLALAGRETGIMDVDIHGPNIAKMLGIEDKRLMGSEQGIEPVVPRPNLHAVSLALFGNDRDQPVIWRGPLKMSVIKQFISDVNWGDLDFLIIDSPPGTGDEPLSVCQLIPGITGAIVVTTPQDVAILDARKSIQFARELNIPVIGVIENMSGFVCPHCGKPVDIFKQGGGRRAAEDMGVPFLGAIPLDPDFVGRGDDGMPAVCAEGDAAKHFDTILKAIAD